jgi:hypothetical protein
VLKKGGVLISGFANPVEYIFDLKALNQGEFQVRHAIPYSDLTSISKEEFEEVASDGVLFGHTLHDQIQGQLDAGFLLAGFYEDKGGTALDPYIDTALATKAVKY